MTEFEAWEKKLFDKYNGEWNEVTEADLYDELDEPEEEFDWKYEQWRYEYEFIA